MKLSFDTVCLVFGVTLVHVLLIAFLSPTGSDSPRVLESVGVDSSLTMEEDLPEVDPLPPLPLIERRQVPPTTLDPYDLPALPREEAFIAPEDPVAISRS